MPVKKWFWSLCLMFYPHCLSHRVGLFDRDKRMSLDVYSHHVFFKKSLPLHLGEMGRPAG